MIRTGKVGADGEAAPHGVEMGEMSAPNPNPGEREFDAMRRAQRAHEPSMEEILASIRAIIADDREGAAANRITNSPSYPPKDAARVPEVDSAPAPSELPPTLVDAPAPEAPSKSTEAGAALVADREVPVVRIRPEIDLATAEPQSETLSAPSEASEAPLLSEAADQAITASFEALSSTLALHNSELVENLTREMLRPMIKTWLDENLPSLVDRLVRAEIQRVARGGR